MGVRAGRRRGGGRDEGAVCSQERCASPSRRPRCASPSRRARETQRARARDSRSRTN